MQCALHHIWPVHILPGVYRIRGSMEMDAGTGSSACDLAIHWNSVHARNTYILVQVEQRGSCKQDSL